MHSILLIGYGNPGRLDDGLGPACAEAVDALELPGVTVDANYQLAVEDAANLANYDIVLFVDAAVSGLEPFSFRTVTPSPDMSFTSHSVEPEALLAMAVEMFDATTSAFILGIRGYEFNEFGEKLSAKADANLREAVAFIEQLVREDRFDKYLSKRAQ